MLLPIAIALPLQITSHAELQRFSFCPPWPLIVHKPIEINQNYKLSFSTHTYKKVSTNKKDSDSLQLRYPTVNHALTNLDDVKIRWAEEHLGS